MTEIKQASKSGIPLIRKLALEAFPATYAKILTPEQTEYMLEMMYSEKSLEKQFDDGHEFFVGYADGEPFGYVSVRPNRRASSASKKSTYWKICTAGVSANCFSKRRNPA